MRHPCLFQSNTPKKSFNLYIFRLLCIVMSKLRSLWEKYHYFGGSCAFLFTEGMRVHIPSTGCITSLKQISEIQLWQVCLNTSMIVLGISGQQVKTFSVASWFEVVCKRVYRKSELRCNAHSFSRQPLPLRSLDLGVVSMVIGKGLGLKKSLCFIVWLGAAVEIRTKTCIWTMPWLRIEGSSPPLCHSEVYLSASVAMEIFFPVKWSKLSVCGQASGSWCPSWGLQSFCWGSQ